MTLGPLMIGVMGCELQPDEREMLLHPLVGGVVLFARNVESAEQIERLVSSIHALREPHLLVAVDQEGGRVQRFRQGFTVLPAISQLGRIYDHQPHQAEQLAEVTGWLMAAELRAVGIDFSFAPVLDLFSAQSRIIGDRAFHADPDIVSRLGQHYVHGMHRAGMAATGKHFPGHGTIAEDSHVEIPEDPRRYEELMLEDLVPFERAVNFGIEALMIAHILYPNIDGHMAGFSPFWLQQVLRTRLGFQGVIFSDDLEMQGATVAGDVGQRVRQCLAAGCDMALVCQSTAAMVQAIDALPEWHNPASQLRLVRMHGRDAPSRVELRADEKWHEAVRLIAAYDEPYTLDLI